MADDEHARVEAVILALCAERGASKTICPTEAAKTVAAGQGNVAAWHGQLASVRRAAVRLARAGRLRITRKGKLVDPGDFKGIYRLGLPPDS